MERKVRLACRAARSYQAVMDALMASVVLFVTMALFGWMLPLLPGFDDYGITLCTSQRGCDYAWLERVNGATGPSFWVSLVLASVMFILASGAFTKSRRSPGMIAASTYPVMAGAVGTPDFSPPGWPVMAARWVIVLSLFIAGVYYGGDGLWGIGFVTAAWLPSLLAGRRSLYDWVTGTAVGELVIDVIELEAERVAD